jgi:hypothetical protein
MSKEAREGVGLAHGSGCLPSVEVLSYNVELKDDEGFVGDRASKGAFREFIENWRKPLRDIDEDPFGDVPSSKLAKKKLDALLAKGEPESAGVIHGAIESFAQEFAGVVGRFLKLKQWKDAERIVVGGGFRGSRVGELAIGRASIILKAEKIKTEISIIRNDPDEAALIGAIHLAPTWMFEAHDAILAVDIGGTNIRTGVVRFNLDEPADIAKARVWKYELWRYCDEKLTRDEAVEGIVRMLQRLINRSKRANLKLAPFIGIGCPGKIEPDGSIETGGQNLPGNWESARFNLPHQLGEAIPRLGEHETVFVMHNDAVVQGLSEAPFMKDASPWGIFTIGTGLGNALFSNR